jgi:hypothetical protein
MKVILMFPLELMVMAAHLIFFINFNYILSRKTMSLPRSLF